MVGTTTYNLYKKQTAIEFIKATVIQYIMKSAHIKCLNQIWQWPSRHTVAKNASLRIFLDLNAKGLEVPIHHLCRPYPGSNL